MPIREILLSRHAGVPIDLADMVGALIDAKCITKNQAAAILHRVKPLLPVNVEISQRSRKGVLYVTTRSPAGETSFALNHRAKVIA